MVKKTENTNVVSRIDSSEIAEATGKKENLSGFLHHYRSPSKENLADDLILTLSDAYENRRARQVFEWERIRRNSLQKAA
jgi:hypothetical protein